MVNPPGLQSCAGIGQPWCRPCRQLFRKRRLIVSSMTGDAIVVFDRQARLAKRIARQRITRRVTHRREGSGSRSKLSDFQENCKCAGAVGRLVRYFEGVQAQGELNGACRTTVLLRVVGGDQCDVMAADRERDFARCGNVELVFAGTQDFNNAVIHDSPAAGRQARIGRLICRQSKGRRRFVASELDARGRMRVMGDQPWQSHRDFVVIIVGRQRPGCCREKPGYGKSDAGEQHPQGRAATMAHFTLGGGRSNHAHREGVAAQARIGAG